MAYTESVNHRSPTRVTGLWRVVFDDPREAFWMGAIRFSSGGIDVFSNTLDSIVGTKIPGQTGPDITVRPQATLALNALSPRLNDVNFPGVHSMPDGIFFISENLTENEITILANPVVTLSDGDFFFLPYRFRDANNLLKNFHGIVVNGHDNPIMIGRNTSDVTGAQPTIGHFVPNNSGIPSIDKDPKLASSVTDENDANGAGPHATFAIRGIRHITIYNGSVVYAGFKTWNPVTMYDDSAPSDQRKQQNFDHFLVFSDTIGSDHSCYSVDTSSTLQIGDNTSEPITGVVVNSVETDIMGIKGQLLIFTPQKVSFFDGLPPIPDDDRDSTFHSPSPPSPIGTWAARTIVRTHWGVVFLGTDGIVYLIPFRGTPIPISRALEPHFSLLHPIQQGRCSAVYHDGTYMLSRPIPGRSNTIAREQWWADMRRLNLSKRDANVRWTGPQGGPPVSMFATGRGLSDTLQVMGGSSTSSQIFELFREDLNTDAPERISNPDTFSGNEAKQVEIRPRAVSNPLDLGDAHIAKNINDIQLGISTDNIADVEITISAQSVDTANGELSVAQETFTETVQGGFGQPGPASGRLIVYPNQGFELVTKRPSKRLRGRAFTLEFRARPASTSDKDPKVAFTDISFGIRLARKRR